MVSNSNLLPEFKICNVSFFFRLFSSSGFISFDFLTSSKEESLDSVIVSLQDLYNHCSPSDLEI